MPSLAEQLAKNASLNANLFVDRSKRKPTVSYLFTGRDADQYDLETIFALGQNAFIQLCSLEPALEVYEEALFSDQAKATDRTLLDPDATKELDRSIEGFLALLGPYVMDAPTGKAIEWLVRRFRCVCWLFGGSPPSFSRRGY
jgi:U3 small nucleolar RNA-associated protein 10